MGATFNETVCSSCAGGSSIIGLPSGAGGAVTVDVTAPGSTIFTPDLTNWLKILAALVAVGFVVTTVSKRKKRK